MNTQTISPQKPKAANQQPVLTPVEVITMLEKLCKARQHAIAYYPHAHGATAKLNTIAQCLNELAAARVLVSPKQIVKACLKLHNPLLSLAPTATSKLQETFRKDLEQIMAACREFLGWRAQS